MLLSRHRPCATRRFGCCPEAGIAAVKARTACLRARTAHQKAWSEAEGMAGRAPAADRSGATSRSRTSGRPPAAGRPQVVVAGLKLLASAAAVLTDRGRAPGGRAGAHPAGDVRPPRQAAARCAGPTSADREPGGRQTPTRAGDGCLSKGECGLAGPAVRDHSGQGPTGRARAARRHHRPAGHQRSAARCPLAADYPSAAGHPAPAGHPTATGYPAGAGHPSAARPSCPLRTGQAQAVLQREAVPQATGNREARRGRHPEAAGPDENHVGGRAGGARAADRRRARPDQPAARVGRATRGPQGADGPQGAGCPQGGDCLAERGPPAPARPRRDSGSSRNRRPRLARAPPPARVRAARAAPPGGPGRLAAARSDGSGRTQCRQANPRRPRRRAAAGPADPAAIPMSSGVLLLRQMRRLFPMWGHYIMRHSRPWPLRYPGFPTG